MAAPTFYAFSVPRGAEMAYGRSSWTSSSSLRSFCSLRWFFLPHFLSLEVRPSLSTLPAHSLRTASPFGDSISSKGCSLRRVFHWNLCSKGPWANPPQSLLIFCVFVCHTCSVSIANLPSGVVELIKPRNICQMVHSAQHRLRNTRADSAPSSLCHFGQPHATQMITSSHFVPPLPPFVNVVLKLTPRATNSIASLHEPLPHWMMPSSSTCAYGHAAHQQLVLTSTLAPSPSSNLRPILILQGKIFRHSFEIFFRPPLRLSSLG